MKKIEEFITIKEKKFYCYVCGRYKLRVRDGAESQDGIRIICVDCLRKKEKETAQMKKEIAKWKKLEPDIKKWKEGYEATQEILKNDPFEVMGIKNPFKKQKP